MSATEQQIKQATKKLRQWIGIDKQVVTYRQIAREVGVNVNVAKNIMLEHLNANESLYATYHLSGMLLPPGSQYTNAQASNGHLAKNGESSKRYQHADDDMDVDEDDSFEPVKVAQKGWTHKAVQESEVRPETVPRYGIILAGAETVESKKRLFFSDSIRVHIYSLAFGTVNDPAMYLTPSLALRSHAAYFNPAKYGTITGTAFGTVAPPAVIAQPPEKESAVASSSKAIISSTTSRSVKPAKAEIKTEETVTKNASTSIKKDGPASAMYTNSSGPKPPSAATSGNKSGADPNLRGRLKGQAVRRIDSDEEEEEEEKPQPVPAKVSAAVPKTASAENEEMMLAMMDMPIDIDESDDADAEALSSNQEARKPPKKLVKKRPSTAQPQDTNMSGDDDIKNPESARPRKRRRVTKSKTFVDEKGYMVDKDFSASESYSSSEEVVVNVKEKQKAKPRKSDSATTTTVDAKPKPKPKAAPPPAKKSGKPGQQSSLMGFFSKKP